MEVEDVAVAGEAGSERVAVRWHFTGTFSGEPWVGIEPTGRPVDMRGMDLLEFQDGRIAGNCAYFDQLSFARQIGMLPAKGSISDRIMLGAFNLVTKARRRLNGGSRT